MVLRGVFGLALFLVLLSCSKCYDCGVEDPEIQEPTKFTLESPEHLPPIIQPEGIVFTEEGVELGKQLFQDPILSADKTISCQTCHLEEFGTTDGLRVSKGINGQEVSRNSMPIFNLVYEDRFFWDGRANTLVEQIFQPINDPREMGFNWPGVEERLKADNRYLGLFNAAYPEQLIDSNLVADAIAQFLFTQFSPMTRYDSSLYVPGFLLSPDEEAGLELFLGDNETRPGGDCFHCHDLGNNLFTDHIFRNNGLTAAQSPEDFPDPGVGGVTGRLEDYGKFKTPSLRRISETGPYMHDGRFATLEEVMEHYAGGLEQSYTVNKSELEFVDEGGVALDEEQRRKIIAFLRTL